MATTLNDLRVNESSSRAETVQSRAFENGNLMVGVITGDALNALRLLPQDTFNVVVTSPPYYWARDYDVDGQLGHEDTVGQYVEKLTEIFEEVRRVLHPDGVFYLNIGDTYYSGNGQPHGKDPRSPSRNFMRKKLRAVDKSGWDIPKKSLIGIPWRVAFSLQSKGWTLRSDIIWNRGNAFVEPTALDRPYRQHEHIFLLTKSRFYSFDRSALLEEDVWNIRIDRGKLIEHTAAFPLALARRCIETGSPEGGYVLDPFSGSGTTLAAANKIGRNAIGIELNPSYNARVIEQLKKNYSETDWQKIIRHFSREPASLNKWNGNKLNFKKAKVRSTN
ncbi:MAG TPA: DNA methyltransferase [Candidatus Angelobacter sp.]